VCDPDQTALEANAGGLEQDLLQDVARKADPAGFVCVLDDKHLVIPERPGNKRFDGLRNILENPTSG